MKLMFAMLLILAGIAGGAAFGMMMRPTSETADASHPGPEPVEEAHDVIPADEDKAVEYVSLERQIVVPVLDGDKTVAFMVFSLAIDVPASEKQTVYAREPLLRDAFLRDLFELSHTGAFRGGYLDAGVRAEVKRKLLASARHNASREIREVLILNFLRKEV